MKEQIPLNPEVLKWARTSAGLNQHEVANRLKKDVETIALWESGDSAPTYVQLERLAYEIYKRPIALFFFPNPPEEETPKQSFRTLPEFEIEMMSSRMHYLLRQARAMQINLIELYEGEKRSKAKILHDLNFNPNVDVSEMAHNVRDYLGVDLKKQFEFKNVDEALKSWRKVLEDKGIFVFKDAFKDDTFSGFCLYDDIFPIIYLNNSKSKTRQIFSLFHELSHLLLGTGGVDSKEDEYIDSLHGDDRRIEILCNKFSGIFLVPDVDFERRISGKQFNDFLIEDLSDLYRVSREVILRKLSDRGLVDSDYYSTKAKQWSDEAKRKPSGPGGDYYATKRAYLGERYLDVAFGKFYRNQISVDQLADYIGVKSKNIPAMEHSLFNRGGAL